jgi:hypothetical protein
MVPGTSKTRTFVQALGSHSTINFFAERLQLTRGTKSQRKFLNFTDDSDSFAFSVKFIHVYIRFRRCVKILLTRGLAP